MSLLLAPYFNSYTQQICIDDAVIVDPERAENILSNDGTTMRILAEQTGKPSVWNQHKEYLEDGQVVHVQQKDKSDVNPDAAPSPAPDVVASYSDNVQTKKQDEEDAEGMDEVALDDTMAKEKEAAKQETQARKEQNLATAADKNSQMVDAATLAKTIESRKQEAAAKEAGRATGMLEGEALAWTVQDARGHSQTVSYTSKFVDKLSEVTDDMNISGSLSIKYNMVGGSGRGSFINTDKFHESDLNFYISVKVTNQSINFKDALEFCPLGSVDIHDSQQLTKVFGDTFISGFLEGGEFNALVSMKILNKAKKMDIQAEAKVALTAGGAEVSGEANVAIAKQNISMNTETTIQVSWCGGGAIKQYDEEWTIDSLIKAASRFPALVAKYPQRTHAILTKYESIRSFIKNRPKALSPLNYENAALYTNMLMDSYMAYKSLYRRISSNIFDVQNGTLQFKPIIGSVDTPTGPRSKELKDVKNFSPTAEGLDAARRSVRQQMNKIVAEVDAITANPELATKPGRPDPCIGPAAFETLIPLFKTPAAEMTSKPAPLTGIRINKPVDESTAKIVNDASSTKRSLLGDESSSITLSSDESNKIVQLEEVNPDIGASVRLTPPVGEQASGNFFCDLDVISRSAVISEVSIVEGADNITSITVTYSNGLSRTVGKEEDNGTSVETMSDLNQVDHIVSVDIYTTQRAKEDYLSIVGLTLVTNTGRILQAEAKSMGDTKRWHFDNPIIGGGLIGFWGRADSDESGMGVRRLGLIWAFQQNNVAVVRDTDSIPFVAGTYTQEDQGKTSFPDTLPGKPQMAVGISQLTGPNINRPRIKMHLEDISPRGFLSSLEGKGDYSPLDHQANWMVIPELSSMRIDCGRVTDCCPDDTKQVAKIDIKFDTPFAQTPVVRCWLMDFDISQVTFHPIHIKVSVEKLSNETFRAVIEAPGEGNRFETASIGWIAHEQPIADSRFYSYAHSLKPTATSAQTITIPLGLASKPVGIFVAFSEINVASTQKLNVIARVVDAEKGKFTVESGTLEGLPLGDAGIMSDRINMLIMEVKLKWHFGSASTLKEKEGYIGDVIVMSGQSRNFYHGVPRVMEGTLPSYFQPKRGDDVVMQACKRFMGNARININARQVFPVNFVHP
ncbi:hypothetical protein QFC22_005113 [Naganishia vaughanmartiniae]|uniref:Uncharacterized protein n=1 Tax=Naganishia vaughanmartiniae TaxID=1424756 RepID=A0ACC2WXD2_9TREE|nr:hypothetical protein QFC22_005113 [Naganishia vaughanmartiniae]